LGKRYTPPAGVTIANPPYVNDNLGLKMSSPASAGARLAASDPDYTRYREEPVKGLFVPAVGAAVTRRAL